MDRRKKDIFEWDVANWSRSLKVWGPVIKEGNFAKALTVGERGGGLSYYLASNGISVTCTDLNGVPDSTKEFHDKHGLGDLIEYKNEDILNLSFPDNTFDVVMFKSVIGALSTKENQTQAIREMHRVLKPGGYLLFAENAKGSALHASVRKRFVKWSDYWRYIEYKGDRDMFADFDVKAYRSFGFLGLFGRGEGQRRILAGLDSVFQYMVPASARYILVGALQKR